MYKRSLGMSVVLVLVGSLSVQAAPAKPKPPANKNNQPAVDAAQLGSSGKFNGTLKNVPGSDRMFSVSITYQELQPNPNYKPLRNNPQHNTLNQHFQNVRNMQQQMARNRNVHHGHMNQLQSMIMQMQRQQQLVIQQEQRMMQQVARAQQQAIKQYIHALQTMYRAVTVTRDFQFQAASDVKVRVMTLPDAFDEKGNIKTYTAEEKAKLKGPNKSLPGYESSIEALQPGQIVQVWLMPHKAPKPAPKLTATPSEKDKPADKDKDLDKDKDETPPPDLSSTPSSVKDKRMQARIIVIYQEANAPPTKGSQQKPGGKKKK